MYLLMDFYRLLLRIFMVFRIKSYWVILAILSLSSSLFAQTGPMVVAFFRPGESYTLCFNREINYKETWNNVAKRYCLNKTELTSFNRTNPKLVQIQQHSLFIPLVFNVNLFMQAMPSAGFVYIPVYYMVQQKQRVANLSLRFREPMLSFIKNYNKLRDYNVLNRNAPIFVGYLKINKSVGWNQGVTKDIKSYRSYAEVQRQMQESGNITKLKQYSIKEKSLMISEDKVNVGAVNVIGIGKPTDQATKLVVAQISPEYLKEENNNFGSFMKRERVEEMRRAKLETKLRKTGIIASNSKNSGTQKARTSSVLGKKSENKALDMPELAEGAEDSDESFFEQEYNEELQSGKQEQSMRAKVRQFRLLFDESNGKFYVLINDVAPGSSVKLTNLATRKSIYARVISATPETTEQGALPLVVVSEKGVKRLGVMDGSEILITLVQ